MVAVYQRTRWGILRRCFLPQPWHYAPRLESNAPESWESRLAAEGLAVVQPGSAVSSKARAMTGDQVSAYVAAVTTWQAWAGAVLTTHQWRNRHQRRVWELHATGTPMRDIPALVRQRRCDSRDGRGSSRASVERIIAAINAAYPERPRNPWSSPTSTPSTGEIATQPPARSLPPDAARALEAVYQPPERKTTLMNRTYKYDLIMFSRRRMIKIPGFEIANDRLLNCEGTPHAGGVDIIAAGKVVTLAWDSISHMVRSADQPLAAVK